MKLLQKFDTTFLDTVYKVSLFCRWQLFEKKLSLVGSAADKQILRKKKMRFFGYDCAYIAYFVYLFSVHTKYSKHMTVAKRNCP